MEREELLRLLEESSGRPLRTREDIRAYLAELEARRADTDAKVRRWQRAKALTLAVLGAFALLQYYFLDVMVQMLAMPQMTFFVGSASKIL